MKIFIAYAASALDIAERLYHRLQSERHEVFFDRELLLPGNTYDRKVRDALQKSQLLIFLASNESISEGAYALTELSLFENLHITPV